ncbi:hypothetical protein AMJ80_06965 [bacterium SM23_31]|nr:MAG: hypothetical protein AMJ80_06965 [bacterium SM23_31]
MDAQQLLQELENLAARLDIAVRYDDGDFKGGMCRIKSDRIIIINKKLTNEGKIAVLARELGTLDLSTIYILPKLRERIYKEAIASEGKTTV